MLGLLLSEGPKARSEVVRMFTRVNMPGAAAHTISKGELITKELFRTVEKTLE